MKIKNLLEYYNDYFPQSKIKYNENLDRLVQLTNINFELAKSFYGLLSIDNKSRITMLLEFNKSIFTIIPIKDMDCINYKLRIMAEMSMRILYEIIIGNNPKKVQFRYLNNDVKEKIGVVGEWESLVQMYGQYSSLIHSEVKDLNPDFSLNKQISKKRVEYHKIAKILEKQIHSFYYLLIVFGKIKYKDLSTPSRLNFNDITGKYDMDILKNIASLLEEQ